MAKSPVHWYEGMFLKPQHFQAADRYDFERVREAEDWLVPHNYGFRLLDIDEAAVGNYRLVLRQCQARFKDGTILTVEPDDGEAKVASDKGEAKFAPQVDSIDLTAAFKGVSEVIVYLAGDSWCRSGGCRTPGNGSPRPPRPPHRPGDVPDPRWGPRDRLVAGTAV